LTFSSILSTDMFLLSWIVLLLKNSLEKLYIDDSIYTNVYEIDLNLICNSKKDWQHNDQKKKDKKNKQRSTKHYTENLRSTNTNLYL
jgi:hypothetical protein